jgi:serine O-acetyltransferase
LLALRKCSCAKNKISRTIYRWKLKRIQEKTLIQIPYTAKIGEGFYIGHFGRVIINGDAIIGKNVNIATGVTIGQESRGKRQGVPTISDNVWIGTNAVIVGKITIGTDVLIAPNSFVNFDVPDHSIVVGNPARIISRMDATAGYVCNKVE